MKKHVSQQKKYLFIDNLNNQIQIFEEILSEDFSFYTVSYQICQNWLKAREGSILSVKDSQKYQKIIGILKDISTLIEEIKTVINYSHLKEMEIFEKVRAIAVEKLEIEPQVVTYTADFANDLGADSLNKIELIIALEEAFNIKISAQAAQTLLTVQQTIDYISQQIAFAF